MRRYSRHLDCFRLVILLKPCLNSQGQPFCLFSEFYQLCTEFNRLSVSLRPLMETQSSSSSSHHLPPALLCSHLMSFIPSSLLSLPQSVISCFPFFLILSPAHPSALCSAWVQVPSQHSSVSSRDVFFYVCNTSLSLSPPQPAPPSNSLHCPPSALPRCDWEYMGTQVRRHAPSQQI